MILFAFLAGIGIIAAASAVTVYAALANGLPPVSDLTNVPIAEETVFYDRTGETELARFGEFKREVVGLDEIPPILLDATTAVEDKTFWENAGFDPTAIVAAGIDSLRGEGRGASTITQQLVRARLLNEDLVRDPGRTVERKLKEIIQSIRLTQAYPGESGKREIIAAYLNFNYYGNQSYGVKAAARSYFGKELAELTPGEAALLAALPQSPSNYDLVRNAVVRCDETPAEGEECPAAASHLVLEPDTRIAQRRDTVLDLMADDRMPMSNGAVSSADLEAAKGQEVPLARQAAPRWRAPHFVWAVQQELARKICGPDTPTCDELTQGGFRVITTLDLRLQQLAEKWVRVATLAPHHPRPAEFAKRLGFDDYQPWMRNLEDKNVRNGALVALDYQTGEVVAHVGSASYYASSTRPQFQPQFDVVTQGYRQPGSAFKPFNYVVGIDDADVHGRRHAHGQRHRLRRRLLADRRRQPRAWPRPRPQRAPVLAQHPGRQGGRPQPARAPLRAGQGLRDDLPEPDTTDAGWRSRSASPRRDRSTSSARTARWATAASRVERTSIIRVEDRTGAEVGAAGARAPGPGRQPAVGVHRHRHPGRQHGPADQPVLGRVPGSGSATGARRPATLKTGTNNDAKDLNAYGYIAPPTEERPGGRRVRADGRRLERQQRQHAGLDAGSAGVLDRRLDVRLAGLHAARPPSRLGDHPVRPAGRGPDPGRHRPVHRAAARIRHRRRRRMVHRGTEPQSRLPAETCGRAALRGGSPRAQVPGNWMEADQDWMRRAERGPGVAGGPDRTRTAYFYNNRFTPYGRTWGPYVDRDGCGASPSPSPSCIPLPTPDASGVIPSFEVPSPSGSEVAAVPCPPPSVEPTPSVRGDTDARSRRRHPR